MSLKDDLMTHYFEWATELPLPEVRATLDAVAKGDLHPREAKEKLARQIVTELHSGAAAEEAAVAFRNQFARGEQPADIPLVRLALDGASGMNIIDLLVRGSFATSKGEARRLVGQRGVKVDGAVAELGTDIPDTTSPVIQYGKRKYARIIWI